MAKDAKGHGSEKRGGDAAHAEGVNKIGITHPIYNTPIQQRHRTVFGGTTPLNADYGKSGSILRQRMSDMSKEDHKAAGDAFIKQGIAMDAQHRDLVDKAMGKLGMQSPGPLISGIVSDKFSEGDKNKLRDLAQGASKSRSAAFAHYAASGMRLDTARGRYQGLKG
jgi:hypothetical protein